MQEKHNVPVSVLRRLPELLDTAVAVYKSKTTPGAIVVATTETSVGVDGRAERVIASIKPGGGAGRATVNVVTSVYAKPQVLMEQWETDGLLLWKRT